MSNKATGALTAAECKTLASRLKCAVIIPTYNNAGTIASVCQEASEWCRDVFVVNDGSTDGTGEILATKPGGVTVIEYPDGKNRGKGYALMTGLKHVRSSGFERAVTMDADGQHFACDIATLLVEEELFPGSFIIGARNIEADGMPHKNTFANKFSNFWFKLFTLETLSDTQSGFRLYPLSEVVGMKLYTPRYEMEMEVAVRLAWRGVRVVNVPVGVCYPEDRVSHFRPGRDFLRISLLNCVLFIVALLWFYPVKCWRWLRNGDWRSWLDRNLLHSGESTERLASAVAAGVMMSVMPIWGFQTVAAICFAQLMGLNKIVAAAAANISLPPFIPFIVYAGMHLGGIFLGIDVKLSPTDATMEVVGGNMLAFCIGSVILGVGLGVIVWPLAWIFIRQLRQ